MKYLQIFLALHFENGAKDFLVVALISQILENSRRQTVENEYN